MNPEKIKLCKICNINECKIKQRRCSPCISKIDNERMREKNYYKDYYVKNKVEYLEHCRTTYRQKNPEFKKLGRPLKTTNKIVKKDKIYYEVDNNELNDIIKKNPYLLSFEFIKQKLNV